MTLLIAQLTGVAGGGINVWNDTDTADWSSWIKTCQGASLSTTHPICTDLGLNPQLCIERLANCLSSHGVVLVNYRQAYSDYSKHVCLQITFCAVHIGTYYQNHRIRYFHLRGGLHVVTSHNTLRLVCVLQEQFTLQSSQTLIY